jgi:pimeloyl-ACP methyl ester carboxylesterase
MEIPESAGDSSFFTTSDGVRIHYIEAGAGEPLVMLPGWSQSAAMFAFQIAFFSRTHRVLAVDPRGHGDSAKPGHGYNAHRMAADVRELILALDLRQVNLFGHSGGVKYIWAYTELFGNDRLKKLVIVDDSPRLIDNPAWSEASRAEIGPMYFTGDLDRFAVQLLDQDGEAFTATAMRSMFSPSFAEREPRLMDWIISENLKMPRVLAIELLYATSGIDWRGTIKRITLPTLVIGAEGSTHKAAVLTWIADQIPGAKLRIWGRAEGGSHFMFLENPNQFNEELARFLA